jgi:hypothetical protein
MFFKTATLALLASSASFAIALPGGGHWGPSSSSGSGYGSSSDSGYGSSTASGYGSSSDSGYGSSTASGSGSGSGSSTCIAGEDLIINPTFRC